MRFLSAEPSECLTTPPELYVMKDVSTPIDIAGSLNKAILVTEEPGTPALTETQYELPFNRSVPISPTISTIVTFEPSAMGDAVPSVTTAGPAAVTEVMDTPTGTLFERNVRSS
jgi:hypothetical protein